MSTMLPSLPKRKHLALICLLFFFVSFGAYVSSLQNEFVTLDDTGLILDNPIVAAINVHTIKQAFTTYDPELYIPLTFVSYQIDHLIAGFNPFIYHFTNLLLHTCNAIFVAWLLFLILQNGWLALGLGMIFAVHPLNSEAVLWASSRKDVLSTFFFLSSLIGYVYASEKENRKLYFMSLLLFLLALLSKVMALTLPVVLVLIDGIRGREIDKRSVLNKVPYTVLSIAFGIIGIFGKTENLTSSTLWQKILMATKSTTFYLEKFLWPTDLSVVYPYTETITLASPDFALPFVAFIGLLIAIAFIGKQHRIAAGGLVFFLVTLLPTFLNFSKGGDTYFASDRYAYVPMIGLLIFVGAIAEKWLYDAYTIRSVSTRRITLTTCFICVIALFGVCLQKQSAIWQNSTTLYEHALAIYPNARPAQNNLGMEQLAAGNVDDALASFQRALNLHSDQRTRINIAAVFIRQKRFAEAEEIYRDTVRTNPEFPDSEYGLGQIAQEQGKLAEAAAFYRRAIEVDPKYMNAYNNLGGVYLALKDWKNAETVLRRSIELKPDFVESSYNLAIALKHLGHDDESEALLRTVIDRNPGDSDALSNLAELLYDRHAIDEAAKMLKRALQIDQNNPTGYDLLLRMKNDGVVR